MYEYKVLQITPATDVTYAVFEKEQPKRRKKFKVKVWALIEITSEDPDSESQSTFSYTKVIGMVDPQAEASGLMTIDEVDVEYEKYYGNFIGYEDEE